MVAGEVARAMENRKRRLPLWMVNLFVFAFLFCAVIAYFLWQVQQARKDFLEHVREHAVLVAEVVQLSARGSVLSKRAAEDILEAFLGNTARFVDYLDKVEPFSQEELDRAVMRNIDGVFRFDCRESALLYAHLTDLYSMHSSGADLMVEFIRQKRERVRG